MICRSCGHNRTDLHTLGHIARVINLVDLTGGKTDLVAIRGITGGGGGDQFALGELAFERFGNRNGRISSTGYTHGLIHVGTAGKRVADASADAGCRTTKRFDFRRMVVGFVLE